MRILVTYGSKMGGTEGLAHMMADSLRTHGHDPVVRPADEVTDLGSFDAVIVGGALYAFRWHKDARRFVRRHTRELKDLPVFFFSSGPLDDSAAQQTIPPVRSVEKLMARVGAGGHMTFGGRMPADARGFPASAMAKDNAGDWRDPDHVDRWIAQVVSQLEATHPVR